ncbi:MAG: hypothetical protein BEN18_11325 [Epulopiscium sp. Nuni2H_MBin001]|nr:MAG: hypothetical protein BEN18_11325 [Epulopiscium sp. Nuni2H_MBin001]
MQIYNISNNKLFMKELLKSSLFDSFLVKEVIICTNIKYIIEGNIKAKDKYILWAEIRQQVYYLMSNSELISYFKIIFLASSSKTILISDEVTSFLLNISYKDEDITITTGCNYDKFTKDLLGEKEWDKKIEKFLCRYNFI